MGRRPRSKALSVAMNGVPVATWSVDARRDDELTYDAAWLESPGFRPLSLSLPAPAGGGVLRGPAVRNYFDNLLPDSDAIRKRIQTRFGTASTDPFELLAAVGRDCVGAVQLTPEGMPPAPVDVLEVEPLDERGVEAELERAVVAPGRADEDEPLRLSIAGAQEKTGLTWHNGRWGRPLGTTPTTHIFKLPLGLVGNQRADMSTSVENEWLCAQLLRGFGLPVAQSAIERFGAQKALVVERFDRRLHRSKSHWLRLPQEDFCQATGTPGEAKYENQGGPGVLAIAKILQTSTERDADLRTLLTAQLLFWMLAAPDGHAKNFSIHLLNGSGYRLTPLYDVVSAWPIVGRGSGKYAYQKLKLAMAVRGKSAHYNFAEVRRRHFEDTARQAGLDVDMSSLIDETVARATTVIADVAGRLPGDFPGEVFESIARGLRESAEQLAAQGSCAVP